MGVKLDIMKAYGRIKWGFILRILELFGFDKKFVQPISQCLTIVSFRLLVNGSPLVVFKP